MLVLICCQVGELLAGNFEIAFHQGDAEILVLFLLGFSVVYPYTEFNHNLTIGVQKNIFLEIISHLASDGNLQSLTIATVDFLAVAIFSRTLRSFGIEMLPAFRYVLVAPEV